jgi:hypothetical protein
MHSSIPLLLSLSVLAVPQDPDAAPFVAALRAEHAKPLVAFAGDVDRDGAGDGLSPDGVLMIEAGTGAPPFTGRVELVVSSGRDWLACSTSALPELAVYDTGDRALVRTTVEDEPISAAELAADLAVLADLGRLADLVGKAEGELDAEARRWTCRLPARTIRASSDPAAMVRPRVLRVELAIVLGANGELESLLLAVQRTDPFGALRRQAIEQGLSGGGGGVLAAPATPGDDPGPTARYALKASAAPSERASKCLAAMRELLAAAR